MDATLEGVTKKAKREPTAEERAAEEMVRRARKQGLSLTGPDGLLKQLTKTVLETALNQELTEHLGHEKHGRPDPDSGNIRNGTRAKTVLTESTGQVGIEVPRDRDGTFEPQIVRKPFGSACVARDSCCFAQAASPGEPSALRWTGWPTALTLRALSQWSRTVLSDSRA